MGKLKNELRHLGGLYRHSSVLTFIIDHTREAKYLRENPRQATDEAHLSGLWNFENDVERAWQYYALSIISTQIGPKPWGDSLEIGCSAGVFTEQLARRCTSVTAYDISPVAVGRAAERCRPYANVRVGELDFASDEVPGQYDLVFVMDVLWYIVGRARQSNISPKLSRALRNGGLLVFSDSRMPKWTRHPYWNLIFPSGADEWAKALESIPGLIAVHKTLYPPKGVKIPGYWDKLFILFRKEHATDSQ